MAPSPAAGKTTGGAPRTPTKLGRKPQSSQTPKLGQAASNTPSSAARKPSAAKAPEAPKPEADTSKASEKPDTDDVAQQAKDTAEDAQDKAADASKEVSDKKEAAPEEASKVEMKDTSDVTGEDDDDENDDEGPLSKVSQEGDDAKGALQEQDPKPIDDDADDAEDTAAGAEETAKEAAGNASDAEDDAEDDAEEDVEEVADDDDDDDDDVEDDEDDATEKAGDTADDTADDADDATDDTQETADKVSGDAQKRGGNLLKGARGLAGKASGLAGKAAQDPTKAAKDAPSDVQDTAEDVAEDAQETAEDAQDVAEDAVDDAEDIAEDAADDAEDAADDAEETAEEVADDAEDAADDAEETAGEVADDAEETADDVADEAKDTADDVADEAKDTADDAKDTADDAKDTADDAQDTAEDAAETAEDAAETAQDSAEDTTETVQDAAGDAAKTVKDTAGDAAEDAQDAVADVADDAKDTADDAKDTADDAKDTAEDAAEAQDPTGEAAEGAEGVTDAAEDGAKDADEDETPEITDASQLPVDLSVLKGLEVGEDGTVVDSEGKPVGKLVEGDAEDLVGYPIGDDGEILDDDGDLVGRCELLPEQVKDQMADLKQKGELPSGAEDFVGKIPDIEDAPERERLPGLEALEGLTCDNTGTIFNEDGDTIGQVTDGDPEELMNATLNEHGEFIDADGNVIGHADIHPDAPKIVDEAQEAAEDAADNAEDAADEAQQAAGEAGEAAEDAKETAEGIEDELPGIEALQGKELNEAGEIVDDKGDVLGEIENEDLKDKLESGELQAEDLEVNEAGEVVDSEGNVHGTVGLAEGAAEKLMGPVTLDLRILDGKKLNKKGKILDEEGEEIGELIEGDAKTCAGKKANDKGEVLDKDGKVIGKVAVVPGEAAEEATHQLLEELGELEEEEEAEEEVSGPQFKIPNLDILEGLKVNKKGKILNEDGDAIGELTSGELADCAGKKVNDKGEVLDEEGNVIGRVKSLPQEIPEEELAEALEAEEAIPEAELAEAQEAQENAEDAAGDAEDAADDAEGAAEDAEGAKDGAEDAAEDAEGAKDGVEGAVEDAEAAAEDAQDAAEDAEAEPELPPLSILEGLSVNKSGKLVDDDGNVVGELTEGDAKKLSKAGTTCDAEGQFWDNKGHVIGRAQTVAPEDPEEESPFAGLEGLIVVKDGFVEDEYGNKVGVVVEGDPKKLVGRRVDEDGDIIDKKGSVVGHADRYEEPEEEAVAEAEAADMSFLEGKTLNKMGMVIGDEGVPVARLVEGSVKDLNGKKLDDQGQIWNDSGKVIGRCELIPESEREAKPEGVFAGLQGLRVIQGGQVADEDDNVVGEIVEGNPKRLVGLAVDEDGDIIDRYGNVKGHAEPLEEEEVVPVDNSILEGKTLNKAGMVIGDEGVPIGRLVEGNAKELIGKKLDDQGQIWNDSGKVIGRCEVIPESEREAKPEGIFAGLQGLRVVPDGKVADEDENVVGQITEGNPKRLVGLAVDEDGDIIDRYGNVKGHAEPLEEEEEVVVDNSILEGKSLNKAGMVIGDEGVPIGRLVEGNAKELAGKKLDGEGQIWNDSGKVIGRCEVIPENEREAKPEGIFAGLQGLRVIPGGQIADEDENVVGQITEGNPKRLIGLSVDEDGDIIDRFGNVKGHAEPLEEEEEAAPIDNTILSGKQLNKQGFVIDDNSIPIGKLVEGNVKELAGRRCDENGNIFSDTGKVIGRCEILPEDERPSKPEGPFAGREGLRVVADGMVADEDDNIVGQIVEGNPKRLIGLSVDEDGDIIDKYGNVKGHADPVEEVEEEVIDNSILNGKRLNKQGYVVNEEGIPIGKLMEGNAKDLAGRICDESGNIYSDTGKVAGRCQVIPENERTAKAEGPFAGLEGLHVNKEGNVEDAAGNVVGVITEGNAKRLVGHTVDDDGDIIDKYGNVKGHAEPTEEEEEAIVDNSMLNGRKLNKQGFIVNDEGTPIGKLVEGNVKELAGRVCDENGHIYSDTGKVAGRCEVIPENERLARAEGPFAGYEGVHVNKEGYVEDAGGNVIGVITEGNAKRLVGHTVDEDGDISDKYGNVKGHAEPYDEPEEEEAVPEDLSVLQGCTVNKAGNVVDGSGTILGVIAEGDPSTLVGKKCDGQGQIWDGAGSVIGRAELAKGRDTKPEGPFAGFDDLTVTKEGLVVTPDGSIVGKIVDGDIKKLIAHKVDEDGEIQDKNGNTIGRAERYDPEDKERRINPMSGRRVNKEGEIRDENGDIMGRLTAGDLGHCVGLEVDDNGYVIDNDGNKVGEVTLIANIADEEEEEIEEEYEGLTEEEIQKQKDREIAGKMGSICAQTLEKVQPICKQITDHMEKADRTPREELDEEELVNNVKPLIEEAGRHLQECNGSLRGLDPDGRIAAEAKGRAGTNEASPEEYRLADTLKELTGTVVTTIDNAKKKLNDMPHAKKKLNPLWGLMTQPLFQILAAVGLLLTGVLGLVGQLLNGLGLGGLVNGLLGGLGIKKLLGGLGLGGILPGGKDGAKKKGALASLPIVGGFLGGK